MSSINKHILDLDLSKIPEAEKSNVRRFLENLLENEKSRSTQISYLNSLKAYFKFFENITKDNMIAFKAYELEHHKPRTAALRVVVLNQYCEFTGMDDCKIKRVKIYSESSIENVPTLEEYNHLLDCLKSDNRMKMYWLVRFIASTGMRASEVVKLKKSCLKTGDFTLWSKGKMRKILIPYSLIEESREYFESVDSDYLFPNHSGEMMQSKTIPKMLSKCGEKYNMRPEIMHPHAFRHLFAVLFLDSSGNLALLSKLLGHESIRTTAIYLELSTEKQKEALDNAVCW